MSNYFNGSGTIGFTCDSCGRETQGCTLVNGMKFCAKCYQETFGETDKDKRIADLEAKLAEREKLIFTYENIVRQKPETALEMCEFLQPYERKLKLSELEIEKLKQQLAEKDKMIDKLHSYYEETLNNGTCGLCEHLRGEYKTDFAIEQLKQTKKLIEEKYTYDVEESDWAVVYELDIDEIFDKQIKKIKDKK